MLYLQRRPVGLSLMSAVDRTLADLAPIFRAVEGVRVARGEPELAWARWRRQSIASGGALSMSVAEGDDAAALIPRTIPSPPRRRRRSRCFITIHGV